MLHLTPSRAAKRTAENMAAAPHKSMVGKTAGKGRGPLGTYEGRPGDSRKTELAWAVLPTRDPSLSPRIRSE